MALLDVVIVPGPCDAGATDPAALTASESPGVLTARTAASPAAVTGTDAEVLVLAEHGVRLANEWYLPVLAAADLHRHEVVIVSTESTSPAVAVAAHRDLLARPDWRQRVEARMADARQARLPQAPVTSGPLVSVFVPTFNRRRMLARALECLAVQTYRDLEVVVVNDGGLDPTPVVEAVAPRLNVRLYHQSANLGRSLAYNRAITEARGRWMTGLADDDTVTPDHVANLVSHAIGIDGPVLTYGPEWLVHEDHQGNERSRAVLMDGVRPAEFLMVENFILAETALFDRALALEVGGFDADLEVLEDWEFWLRLAQRSTLVHVPRPTSEYRIRETVADNSLTTRGPSRFFDTQQAIYGRYPVPAGSWLERIRNARLDQLRPRQSGQHVFEHTIAVVGDGNVDALVRCLDSIAKLAETERVQVIVHEVRTPGIEAALDDMDGQIVCLSDRYDADHALARIRQQAGGRQVHVISSSEVVC